MNEKGTREKIDDNEDLSMDDNEKIELDSDEGSFAEKDGMTRSRTKYQSGQNQTSR